MRPQRPRVLPPDPAAVPEAVEAMWNPKLPLVITDRGARGAGAELVRFLDAASLVYLDTQESHGLVAADHTFVVGAMRGLAVTEADVAVLVGRKFDYQLGYCSPVVFPNARFYEPGRHAVPRLTTIRIDGYAIGATAAEMVLSPDRGKVVDLGFELTLRESS